MQENKIFLSVQKLLKMKKTWFFRCLDNDVDETSLAAAAEAERNNLDRDTTASGDQASGKPNIDIGDTRCVAVRLTIALILVNIEIFSETDIC